MCKYCDIKNIQKCAVYYGNSTFGQADNSIAETKYEDCRIAIYNDRYVIYLSGSYEDFSEPIKYCPFCGRKLNE